MPKLPDSEKRTLCFNLAMSYLRTYPGTVVKADPTEQFPSAKSYAQAFFIVERDIREIVESWEKGTLKASL